MHMMLLICNVLLLVAASLAEVPTSSFDVDLLSATKHHLNSGRGGSLFDSSWPADHGDVSRSKYSLGYGLPRNFDRHDLKVQIQSQLPSPQWLYTQGDDSKFVYLLGGTLRNTYVAKVDSVSLEVIQKRNLPPAIYLGGLLMHSNGHVYGIHANTLYRFWDGDLTNSTEMKLPTMLNGAMVQTNGMLVTQDGHILIKQWAVMLDDILFYASGIPQLGPIIITMFVMGFVTCWWLRSDPLSKRIDSLISNLIFSAICGQLTGLFVIWVCLSLAAWKPFNPIPFVLDSGIMGRGSGGGELKVIDALSFEIIAEATLPERCSIARMSMTAVQNFAPKNNNNSSSSEDVIILLGDELAFQYRWRPASRTLHFHPAWTQRYRRIGDGSFQATGAALYNGTAYFTDNTFPVYLRDGNYRMYRAPLEVEELDRQHTPVDVTLRPSSANYTAAYREQRQHSLDYISQALFSSQVNRGISLVKSPSCNNTSSTTCAASPSAAGEGAQAGFMFWSVVVSPIEHDIITWDTAAGSVQARRLNDLSLHWELKAWQADCLTVAADRGHVYLSDYSAGTHVANAWLPMIGQAGAASEFKAVNKFFIIADTATGAVLGNVTVGVQSPMRISMIIPGAHNDVFLGTAGGLARVHV